MKFYIYTIRNTVSGKLYVGKTSDPEDRWNKHMIYAAGGKDKYPAHFQYVHASIAKYGKEQFSFQVIGEHEDELDCFEAEKFWIQFFRSWDKRYGYNLTLGGEGSSGKEVSEETKDKIRVKAIGRTHSDETKNKISEAGKKRINSPETRQRISSSNKGRKQTEEQRLANSSRQIGKKLPESQVENMKKSAKRGEKSPRAKLTNEQAMEMRRLFRTGNYLIKDLAQMFGVGATAAGYIIGNKTYKE